MIEGYPFPLYREIGGLHAPEAAACEVEFAEILYWIIRANNYKRILEIGAYKGHTTWWFNEAAKAMDGEVTVVDPKPFLLHNKALYLRGQIWECASDAFFRTNKRVFDFIFIDGDHSYQGCFSDYVNSLGCLATGGCIALHDTLLFDGVNQVVRGSKGKGRWTHLSFGKGLSWVMP